MTRVDRIDDLVDAIGAFHPGTRVRPWSIVARGAAPASLASDPVALARLIAGHERIRALVFVTPDGRVLRRRFSPDERKVAYFDCNNLVWSAVDPRGRSARRFDAQRVLATISAAVERLRALGVTQTHGVADHSVRRMLVSEESIDALRRIFDRFTIAEPGVSADCVICGLVEDRPGIVVTNDRMRDWRKTSPWLRRNLWRLLTPIAFRPEPDYLDVESELRSIVPSGRSCDA